MPTLEGANRFASLLPEAPIVGSDNAEITYLPPDQFAARQYDVTATNPIVTFLWGEDSAGGDWEGLCMPAFGSPATYKMFYLTTPTDLADTDTTTLPVEFRNAWILRATQLALQDYTERAAELEHYSGLWREFVENPDRLETLARDVGAQAAEDAELGAIASATMAQIRSMGISISRFVAKQAALEAFNDIWYMHNWSFRRRRGTASLTSGNETATIATDFGSLDDKATPYCRSGTNIYDMHVVPYHNLIRLQNTNPSRTAGTPHYMGIDRDFANKVYQLQFEPPVDGSYTLNYVYYASAPSLTDAAGATALPADFRAVWKALTSMKALMQVPLDTAAQRALEAANLDWKTAKRELHHRDKVAPGYGPLDQTGDLAMLLEGLN